jgi:protein O-GlcNAc transferase
MTLEQQFSLADSHRRAGRLAEAEAIYRKIVAENPDHAEALNRLGLVLRMAGQTEAAVEVIRRAIALSADNGAYYNNLGIALHQAGRVDEAVLALESATRLKPDSAGGHSNLGFALLDQGRAADAVASLRRAIFLKPDLAEAHNNLGNALAELGEIDEAIRSYGMAIELKPNLADAHYNLGEAWRKRGKIDESIESYGRAIRLNPNSAKSHNNLGVALKDAGRLDESICEYREALRLKPDFAAAHSNLVYAIHFHPGWDAKMIREEHQRWNEQHARQFQKLIQPHGNDRNCRRRLRIGYVSPDFREHPVGRFLLPLLSGHDRERFEIYCYSDVRRTDRVTELLYRHTDRWQETARLSDERLSELIRNDKIDILIDLTMHMANNRMLVFARKPAPVQATYLAYCSTTGLEAMDYRLSDSHLDPPGTDEGIYGEKSIRLAETYWCYEPPEGAPEVGALPASAAGVVTFGCLNNFCKVSPEALNAWAKLLEIVPQSRLILHGPEGGHRQRVWDFMAGKGIGRERISFVGAVPLLEYLNIYHRIDIALDPFPYAGGTTTCDALWMGVPVVTLAGRTAVGRAGVSILSNVGLPELIGQSHDAYVEIAAALGNDLGRLGELRRTLRRRMAASPIMDSRRYVKNVENAYEQMWRKWVGAEVR